MNTLKNFDKFLKLNEVEEQEEDYEGPKQTDKNYDFLKFMEVVTDNTFRQGYEQRDFLNNLADYLTKYNIDIKTNLTPDIIAKIDKDIDREY